MPISEDRSFALQQAEACDLLAEQYPPGTMKSELQKDAADWREMGARLEQLALLQNRSG